MDSLLFLFIVYTALGFCTDVHSSVLVEDGSTFTFSYSGVMSLSCDSLSWYRREITINACFQNSNIPSTGPRYECLRQPFVRQSYCEMKLENSTLTTNLTVTHVNRSQIDSDEGLWTLACNVPYNFNVTTFELKIYTKSKSVVCKTDITKSGIWQTCTIEGIYPQAKFYLEVVFNQTKWPDGISSDCQNVHDSSMKSYTSTCVCALTPETLSIGRLELNATVYPDLTSSLSDLAYGTSTKSSLYFENPRIILEDCTDDDIDDGATFTCTCQRSDKSDIPTNLVWLINGTEQITSANRYSVLKTTTTPFITNYTCLAVNVFGWPSSSLAYQKSVLSADNFNDYNVGAVVGGVLAGIIVLCGVTLAVVIIKRNGGCTCYIGRKSRAQKESQDQRNEMDLNSVEKEGTSGKHKKIHYKNKSSQDNNLSPRNTDNNILNQSDHYSRGGEYDVTQPSVKDSQHRGGPYENVARKADSDYHEYQDIQENTQKVIYENSLSISVIS